MGSMKAGGGTARGHGERGTGTRGEAAPDMGLGLAGPGLGLVWPGSGLGWEWKTHIKQLENNYKTIIKQSHKTNIKQSIIYRKHAIWDVLKETDMI